MILWGGEMVKKRTVFLLSGFSLLLLAGLALLLFLQGSIRESAHDWEGERTPRGDHILESFRRDTAETAMASFRVLAEDGTVVYTCPESWRTMDLKDIGWSGEGYDIQVVSGDVGTVTYFHTGEVWRAEAEGRLALRAEEGEILSPDLLLAPIPLEEAVLGNLVGYARIRADGWVFEWLESDYYNNTPEMSYQEEKVLISREGGQDCQVFEMWDYSWPDVDPEEKLLYDEDVDFDGLPDLLACTGHHGNQGFLTYDCYLQRDSSFEECPSYADIWFPTIDSDNKRILSFHRNSAASHTWGIYEFRDGEFVPTHFLTEEPAPDWQPTKENDGDVVWQWTVDGKIVGRSDTLTEEEIDQLFAYFGYD